MWSCRKAVVCTLACILVLVPTLADAGDAPTGGKLEVKPGAGYVLVGDIIGTVVKADANGIVLRITQVELTGGNKGGNVRPGNIRPGGKANSNPAQQQQQQMRRVLQAIQQQMRQAANVKVKETHHDYDLPFLEGVTVRTKVLPPNLDENGRPKPRTPEELQKLKGEGNLPFYAATVSDIQPGQIVEVYIVQPKNAAADKSGRLPTPAIRTLVILGQGLSS